MLTKDKNGDISTMRYVSKRFENEGSIDSLLMTITRRKKCGIFHLLLDNALKFVQIK